MMHVINGPPSWNISSHVRIVLKGLAFWSKVIYIIFQMRKVIAQRLYRFCLQEKIMAQKIFWGMGNFRSTYPKALIEVTSEYHDLGTCVFGPWKGLSSLKLQQVLMHTKLPIISSYKKFIFSFAWFSKNLREFPNQEFYGQLPEQAWLKSLFDFTKSCPLGHQGFQKIPKWKKVFIMMCSLPTVITNSFRISVVQKFENIFTHIFVALDLFSF